ncbi:hypothetical protein [Bacteroides sp.]|uniref:hypothetical protein n=1 Tax=Bacteroides sp. TaxID=29523 RepID=UPI00262B538A|nr:hypothetical protein [Bacteroides sp.]
MGQRPMKAIPQITTKVPITPTNKKLRNKCSKSVCVKKATIPTMQRKTEQIIIRKTLIWNIIKVAFNEIFLSLSFLDSTS